MQQKFKLPKESLVQPEDGGEHSVDGQDVEGHSLPITAPPSNVPNLPTTAPPSFDPGLPTRHGGEFAPTDTEDGDST
jgi:hypothetical protein